MRDPFRVEYICAPGNDGRGWAHVGPDCQGGKHKACRGEAWCYVEDEPDRCVCPCHETSGSEETGGSQ